ncbi:hydrogen peroxide-dependent heme synthase [Microbacterium telephonicum]|uniref:Coproheme decarboxylase n=1 Tax=Microbacterium telephonicum TaxID=1714841 RepID=A0A498C8T5_9MICO|nr:hydrogen peroxide-dependent heme synthase [Microbacterium telephonicum]RLK48948.1 chlorite dismutase [Microbacterium telephonicum]
MTTAESATPETAENPVGYTLFAILTGPRPRTAPSASALGELQSAVDALPGQGVTLRGLYDVTGMRGDADLMVWLHCAPGTTSAPDAAQGPESLQKALRSLRRTAALAAFACEWSAMGVHREAEFNKRHVPGYLRGEHARGWLCLYPFVRSYEWYLLPADERSAMLAEHGRKGARFTDVVANTVSTFGLSDYEWLLPLESDDPIHLVDMMRDLRATDARRHVREEVPFYTGRRVDVAELEEVLA